MDMNRIAVHTAKAAAWLEVAVSLEFSSASLPAKQVQTTDAKLTQSKPIAR
jgi:hypothetical protein